MKTLKCLEIIFYLFICFFLQIAFDITTVLGTSWDIKSRLKYLFHKCLIFCHLKNALDKFLVKWPFINMLATGQLPSQITTGLSNFVAPASLTTSLPTIFSSVINLTSPLLLGFREMILKYYDEIYNPWWTSKRSFTLIKPLKSTSVFCQNVARTFIY